MRRQIDNFPVCVTNTTGGGVEQASQGFQRTGLAGAVGTDQRDHLARVDVEGDAAHGLDAAIGHTQAFNDKQGHRS